MMSNIYEIAQLRASEIKNDLINMGYDNEYAEQVIGNIDPTSSQALSLCFEYIDLYPPMPSNIKELVKNIITNKELDIIPSTSQVLKALKLTGYDSDAAIVYLLSDNPQNEQSSIKEVKRRVSKINIPKRLSVISPEKKEKNAKLYANVMKEFLLTEKSYVDLLEACVEEMLIPAKEKELLPAKHLDIVFGDIEGVLNLNKQFLQELNETIVTSRYLSIDHVPEEWLRQVEIGQLIVSYAPFFKLYITYVNNHAKSTALIRKLREKKKYQKFFEFTKTASNVSRCKNNNLGSFLIMPCQRVPRYSLLLKELIKRSDAQSVDLKYLKAALAQMETTADTINKALRYYHDMAEVLRIQNQFNDNVHLIATHRHFICQLSSIRVSKLKIPGRKRIWRRNCEIFLFNSIIVGGEKLLRISIGKNNDGRYSLAFTIPVDFKLRIHSKIGALPVHTSSKALKLLGDNNNNDDDEKKQSSKMKKSFSFEVSRGDEVYIWECKSLEEKDEAIKKLKHILELMREKDRVHEETGHTVRKCQVCNTNCPLSERRQCRLCLKVVHVMCSNNRRVIPQKLLKPHHDKSLIYEKSRLCDICLQIVHNNS